MKHLPIFALIFVLPSLAFCDPDALALPRQNLAERVKQLDEFMSRYPGDEFFLRDNKAADPKDGYRFTGLMWQGFMLYVRKERRSS